MTGRLCAVRFESQNSTLTQSLPNKPHVLNERSRRFFIQPATPGCQSLNEVSQGFLSPNMFGTPYFPSPAEKELEKWSVSVAGLQNLHSSLPPKWGEASGVDYKPC
jgi:hypothetical protein